MRKEQGTPSLTKYSRWFQKTLFCQKKLQDAEFTIQNLLKQNTNIRATRNAPEELCKEMQFLLRCVKVSRHADNDE